MILRAAALTLALTGGAAAQDGPVPDCSEAEGLQDCALLAGPLLLVFLHQTVSDGAILTVTQSTAEGGAREVSAEIPIKGVVTPPVLYDLDGDGVEDLFVPVASADPMTSFQLWVLSEAGFYFWIDTVSAVVPQSFMPIGDLILHIGPEVEGRTIESAYFLDEDGMTLAYAVQMDAAAGNCSMITGNSIWNEAIILADCEARLGEMDLEDDL